MRSTLLMVAALTGWSFGSSSSAQATPVYWSVFNVEGESSFDAAFVTYGALEDMLADSNRTGVFSPGTLFSTNIVGSGSDGTAYWSVFNIEGESSFDAAYVTYTTLDDMLADSNRTGVFSPGTLFSNNVVGSGSDGSSYWSVFNIEGESSIGASYVTYQTLNDMLADSNRTGVFSPGTLFSTNIVGSGSDGTTYWSVFNVEDESSFDAAFVTYATLDDMLADSNRMGVFSPGTLFSNNIVGSGAFVMPAMPPVQVPEPATLGLFGFGLAYLGLLAARPARRRHSAGNPA